MRSTKLIVNASPVISLAKIGYADLLIKLFEELVVPRGVYEEVSAHGINDEAVLWLDKNALSLIKNSKIPQSVAEWNLGRGESEVIALAISQKGVAVALDDRAARRCAQSFGIKVKGTVSIIVDAKRQNIIKLAAPLLNNLKTSGFRVSDQVIEQALSLTGEI